MGREARPRLAAMLRTIRRLAERFRGREHGPPRVAKPRRARRVMWNNHATSAVHVNHKPARYEPPADLMLDESEALGSPFALGVYNRLRFPGTSFAAVIADLKTEIGGRSRRVSFLFF